MPVSVTMPRLGESVTEGTVTRWLKQEGDHVEADEPLLEVSTDKVDTEIPSPAAGVLTRIVVHEDETAEVGSELAVIGDADGDAGGSAPGGESTADTATADASAGDESTESAATAEATTGDESTADAATEEPADGSSVPTSGSEGPDAVSEQDPDVPSPDAGQPADHAPTADGAQSAGDRPPADAESAPQQARTGGPGTALRMPALGESVTEGTVTRWLKGVGDTVEADEPLLEVSTDKVDTEIPSPVSGTILEIKVGEDETVDVGAELAIIGAAGGAAEQSAPEQSAPEQSASEQSAQEPVAAAEGAQPGASYATPTAEAEAGRRTGGDTAETAAAPSQPSQAQPSQAQPSGSESANGEKAGNGKVDADEAHSYVTPLVRKLAAENGVDLGSLTGTGVGGRIRKQDVLEAAERQRKAAEAAAKPAPAAPAADQAPATRKAPAKPAEPSPLRGRTEKLTRMRSVIAKRMVESLQTSAQLTTVIEVDVTRIARLRDQAKQSFQRLHGVKLSFMAFFAVAAVEALRVHPKLNASIDTEAGTVTYHDAEHLVVAVDTERGLMVPVIHNAGDLNLAGLAKRINDLAERTRSMKVTPDELAGGTFTLTNTGSRGALFDTAIFTPPQVAILGTGAVVRRPVVVNDPDLGEIIVPRSMVYLALSYDHRLVDGADAARFLTTVKDRLEGGHFESELGLS